MDEFVDLMQNAGATFGYLNVSNSTDSDFVSLSLPQAYLLPIFRKGKNLSGVKALIFLLDFCVSIATTPNGFSCGRHGQVASGVSRMGTMLPRTKANLKKFLDNMQMCIFQIVDRIAKTQLGQSRTSAIEYEEYINPQAKKPQMPKPNNRFPDFAGESWKAVTREQSQAEEEGNIKIPYKGAGKKSMKKVVTGKKTMKKVVTTLPAIMQVIHEVAPKGAGKKTMKNVVTALPSCQVTTKEEVRKRQREVECAKLPDEKKPSLVSILSRDRLAVLAPLFTKAFKDLKSEKENEDMQWTILRLAHEQSPIPLIGEAMRMIVESLEQQVQIPATVTELEETDVCATRTPKAFVERTALFVEEYAEVEGKEAKTNVLKRIVVSLKAEGFRFLEEQQMEGWWQPMSMASAIQIVRKRMNRHCQRRNQNSQVVLEPLDPAPGPFMERNPFFPNGEPADMSIVCGKEKEAKGKPANAAYRQVVAKVAPEFKNASRKEKGEITMRLVEELRNKGYCFVFKKNDTWQEMEQTNILEKIRHSLRDSERTREKKNAAGEIRKSIPEGKGTAEEGSTCPEETNPVEEGSTTNANNKRTAEESK
jgi:hypothetical protein